MPLHLLLATIPKRKASAERLLQALADQTLLPNVLHLLLDGYDNTPSPVYPSILPVREHRTSSLSGPGARWRVLSEIPKETVLVVLDDDQILRSSTIVETLFRLVGQGSGGAIAYMGTEPTGWGMAFPHGTTLISMGAAVMAVRMADLEGLEDTLAEVREKCGFDPFGDGGDDEAIISAHLWRRGVSMRATGPLAIETDFPSQVGSQSEKRRAMKGNRSLFWQRQEIARVTGWPWRSIGG